jgi:hypothetical protein
MLVGFIALLPPVQALGDVRVVSSSSFYDSLDALWVVGEVENIGDMATDFTKVTATFYDSSNQVIDSDYGYADLDVLLPDRKSPFSILFLESQGSLNVHNYTLSVSWDDQPAGKTEGIEILSSSDYIDGSNHMHVTGEVKNQGTLNANFTKVFVTFYDSQGTVVGTDYDYTEPTHLTPQETATYDVELIYAQQVAKVASYSLTAESTQYAYSPTPSPSPSPSPTPPPNNTSDTNVTIVSHSGYLGPTEETYYIVGEVQNLGTEAVLFVYVEATLYDSDITFIATEDGPVFHSVIMPNQKAPFVVMFANSSQASRVDTYTLSLSIFGTTSNPRPEGLTILSQSFSTDEFGVMCIDGEIQNTGSESATDTWVFVTCYDSNGTVVECSLTRPELVEISAGEQTVFELEVFPDRVPLIDTFVLSAISDEYRCYDYPTVIIPEALTVGIIVLLSSISLIASFYFLQKCSGIGIED